MIPDSPDRSKSSSHTNNTCTHRSHTRAPAADVNCIQLPPTSHETWISCDPNPVATIAWSSRESLQSNEYNHSLDHDPNLLPQQNASR